MTGSKKARTAMNLDEIIALVTNYVQGNLLGSAAAGVILLVLLFRKPKFFLGLVLLCATVVGMLVIFDQINSTGINEKEFQSLGEVK
ncbi:MAG: hypothetical protein JSU90_04440 [Nitrospiraceae bacterium]|nr:MAG: hypothetical protein JSU90_04440 [Nitrospiraceae bacterium]